MFLIPFLLNTNLSEENGVDMSTPQSTPAPPVRIFIPNVVCAMNPEIYT